MATVEEEQAAEEEVMVTEPSVVGVTILCDVSRSRPHCVKLRCSSIGDVRYRSVRCLGQWV